jgi:mannan endo-1,6-alpha-mannosidase
MNGLVNRTIEIFFPNGIAIEPTCELPTKIQCTTDQLSFKGYLHRWMAQSTQVAPFTHDKIMATLRTSAAGAVKACSGGANGRQCGFRWTTGTYDGVTGAGQEMSALAAVSSLLVDMEDVPPPLTNGTGGTSQGDPSAGSDPSILQPLAPITAGDRAGAGILTALILGAFTMTMVWLNTHWMEGGRGMYSKASH